MNLQKPFAKNSPGFTLIEVLMAVAVLAIGILAAASMQTSSVSKTTSLRKTTMAVECASDIIERLFELDFNNPYLSAGAHTPGAGIDFDGDGNDDMPVSPQYNAVFRSIGWTVNNQSLSGTGVTDARVITVTVTWGNGRFIRIVSARTREV
ncbi:MAG: hypothetical protein B5M56_02650 [Desulfococcus sp. 4484_241]|nr:MAG: hypothetical protein B5M56_02650 [Desulfococcus sp. 4484_241]